MAINSIKVALNGENYTLVYNSSTQRYEATITAPSVTSWSQTNNKYGLVLTATDTAGNITIKDRSDATLGGALQLRVLEKTKPTVTLTYPSSGARISTSRPKFTFSLRDSGSGINISTLQLKINSGTTITNVSSGMICTTVSGGFDCEYTPPTSLIEGDNTVTLQISDNDGNTSTLVSSSFIIDTVPPSLNITSPASNLITNSKTLVVSGTTNDATSSPVSITIRVNDVDQGVITVSGGSFSKTVTLIEGENTISITALDSSNLTSNVTRTITVDTVLPVITSVSLTPNPVDSGKSFVISVIASD